MTNKIILALEAEQMTKEIPPFAPGDTIVVQVKVKEGDRSRLQAFDGVVIAKPSCTTCVTCPVKQLASRKNWLKSSFPMQKKAAFGLLFCCLRFIRPLSSCR